MSAPVDRNDEAARRPSLRLCGGPRASEEALLGDLEHQLTAPLAERLERPLLVVVPSRSLRVHFELRIASRLGPAVLGLTCRTLRHVAIDLLERTEGAPPINDGLLPLLTRRFARHEPVLRRAFEPLDDGYRTVAGSVRDLLEAGLEPALVDGLSEELEASGRAVASAAELDRARALLGVAARVADELERLGIADTSTLLRRAAEWVRAGAPGLPRLSFLAIIGFADATGLATDLLEALLTRYGGALYLDRPLDPADRERDDSGNSFSRRFSERLASVAARRQAAGLADEKLAPAPPSPTVEMFRAVGAGSEVREVARRVRALLAVGIAPEEIGLVARRLEPYRFALREELDALAVPYSAFGTAGPQGPEGRRLGALLELLKGRDGTPIDRWLDLQDGLGSEPSRVLLRQALLCLGAGRLGEVATLHYEGLLQNGRYPLPVRQGFDELDPDEEEPARVLARRSSVAAGRLEKARDAARRVTRRLTALSGAGSRQALEDGLRKLVERDLGWGAANWEATRRLLDESVQIAGHGLAAGWPLELDEWIDLLTPACESAGALPIGGEGGGVQCLDVIEARGRTFGYLFVLGLNRGAFPRVVVEDPLLPDPLRHLLARSGFGLLPDLPEKRDGYAEERYLFAQLVDAAPYVTLSWLDADEEGARLTPSPLVERLRWRAGANAPESWRETPAAPHRLAAATDGEGPRPVREAALLAGLRGDRRRFAELLPLALVESGARGGVDPGRARGLAAARLGLLAEIDPDLRTPEGRATRARLGPYLGAVGPPAPKAADPRASGDRGISVTTLEAVARCPWQAFLSKLLRLEPSADPLELLPAIEGRLVGSLVHDVLEAVALPGAGPPASLDEALARLPFGTPWPNEEELARLVADAASRLVAREGIALPGFDRALAAVVGRHLEEARRLDWAGGRAPDVVAVEHWGAVQGESADDPLARLRFRADRVDRLNAAGRAEGPRAERPGLCYTDYKTGRRPLADRPNRLATAVHDKIRSGEALQGAAYALARGYKADRGRYLYLHPELLGTEPPREVDIRAGDPEIEQLFRSAVAALVAAWDAGHFFPRLIHADRDKEPELCSFCRVAEACVRGDSGARGRLRDWADGQREQAGEGAGDDAWLAAWLLDSAPPKGRRR